MAADYKAAFRFLEFLHRRDPQPQHPPSLWPGGPLLLRLLPAARLPACQLTPVPVAAYIEQLGKEPKQRSISPLAKPSIKQQLATGTCIQGLYSVTPMAAAAAVELAVKRGQRQPTPQRQLQVGSIVN